MPGNGAFFHLDGCDKKGEEPTIGDRVTYEVGADRKPGKVCAKQVRFVGQEDEAPPEKAPAVLFKAPEEVGVDWLTRDQK